MRGTPGKYVYVKGIYLGRGINHIDRTVCCLDVEKNGGMSMIIIQEFTDSIRIKHLYIEFFMNL